MNFPKLLSECPDAPAILYQKGEFDENRKFISIGNAKNDCLWKEVRRGIVRKIGVVKTFLS